MFKYFKTIMIVDDDADMTEVLKDKLEMEGFNVIVQNNGCDAIRVAESVRPDLIIIDIMMPCIDGIELHKELKRRPLLKSIPALFLTGLKKRNEGKRERVLAKPFDFEEVMKNIDELTTRSDDNAGNSRRAER